MSADGTLPIRTMPLPDTIVRADSDRQPRSKPRPAASRALDARQAHQVLGYALRIRGVRVQSHMGVSDSERAVAQELVVGVDVELPGETYPMADELERAADYAAVVAIADETARDRGYLLLETFAFQVATRLVDRFALAERVRVAATKAIVPVTPRTDEATVEVTLVKG